MVLFLTPRRRGRPKDLPRVCEPRLMRFADLLTCSIVHHIITLVDLPTDVIKRTGSTGHRQRTFSGMKHDDFGGGSRRRKREGTRVGWVLHRFRFERSRCDCPRFWPVTPPVMRQGRGMITHGDRDSSCIVTPHTRTGNARGNGRRGNAGGSF